MRAFLVAGGLLALACAIGIGAAQADPVVDSFYESCVSENSYQMAPTELADACGCMAPVLVSFLTVRARQQVEESIRTKRPPSFNGSPFKGNPAELARSAIAQCPSVGEAMYRQKCRGANEATPQCQEMKDMVDQAQ